MYTTTPSLGSSKPSDWLNLPQSIIIREILYGCMLVLLAYILRKLGGDTGIFAIPLAAVAWYYRQPLWQARIIIFVLCGSSTIGAALYCTALALLAALQMLSAKPEKLAISHHNAMLLVFISLAMLSSLLNQIVTLNVVALPLWAVSFLAPFGIYFYFRHWPLSTPLLSRFMAFMIVVAFAQCFVAWVDYIKGTGFRAVWSYAVTPDFVTGTFRNAPEFGIYLLQCATIFIAVLMSTKLLTKTTIKAFLLLAFILVFIHTSDSKTQLYAFGIGWLSILIIYWKWQWNDRATKWIIAGLFVAIIAGPALAMKAIDKYNSIYIDYLKGDKAAKLIYMKDAMDPRNRPFFHWLAGYGPGSCGSRVSNMRAYDTLPKNRQSDAHQVKGLVPAHSSECTKQFLVPVWSWEYAERSKHRSALLGNPFNSWTALWFETGVVGVALWAVFMFKLLVISRRTYLNTVGVNRVVSFLSGVNVIAVCVIALIIQAFEDPKLMMFVWFFISHMIAIADYIPKLEKNWNPSHTRS